MSTYGIVLPQRGSGAKMRIRLPYPHGSKASILSLLTSVRGLVYEGHGVWSVPRKNYLHTVDACVERFGSIETWRYVEAKPFELGAIICTEPCWSAREEHAHIINDADGNRVRVHTGGEDPCDCVCADTFHGMGLGFALLTPEVAAWEARGHRVEVMHTGPMQVIVALGIDATGTYLVHQSHTASGIRELGRWAA